MSDWDQQFAAMRAQFLARANDRLSLAAGVLYRLEQQPTDITTMQDMRQHFHWLAGVGGTYKIPGVSDLGAAAEELCDEIIDGRRTLSSDDIRRLSEILDRAKTLISRAN